MTLTALINLKNYVLPLSEHSSKTLIIQATNPRANFDYPVAAWVLVLLGLLWAFDYFEILCLKLLEVKTVELLSAQVNFVYDACYGYRHSPFY